MTIIDAIQKALDYKWKPGTELIGCGEYDGNYFPKFFIFKDDEGDQWQRDLMAILSDYKFWQAFDKYLWDRDEPYTYTPDHWSFHSWHLLWCTFIDHLTENKPIESFFKKF